MTDRDWGTQTAQTQPGRRVVSTPMHQTFIHLSASHLKPSCNNWEEGKSVFINVSTFMSQDNTSNPLKVDKCADLRCTCYYSRRERVIWAAAKAAASHRVHASVCGLRWRQWGNQNRGSSTAQNRHLMVKVCTDVAGGGVRVLPLQDVFNPKQIWRQALRTAMKCG